MRLSRACTWGIPIRSCKTVSSAPRSSLNKTAVWAGAFISSHPSTTTRPVCTPPPPIHLPSAHHVWHPKNFILKGYLALLIKVLYHSSDLELFKLVWGPLRTVAKGCDHEIVRAVKIHLKAILVENWNWLLCGHWASKCSVRHTPLGSQLNALSFTILFTWGLLQNKLK